MTTQHKNKASQLLTLCDKSAFCLIKSKVFVCTKIKVKIRLPTLVGTYPTERGFRCKLSLVLSLTLHKVKSRGRLLYQRQLDMSWEQHSEMEEATSVLNVANVARYYTISSLNSISLYLFYKHLRYERIRHIYF